MSTNTTNKSSKAPFKPPSSESSPPAKKRRVIQISFTFILLFSAWILLSGKFDPFHLSLGVISCLIIALISGDLLFESVNFYQLPRQVPRFFAYIPWLLIQVFKANIHVILLSFHPRLLDKINPRVIQFKSQLKSEFALTTFANSITLTPGTITIYATEYGYFEVHVIDDHSGEGIPGEMEQRVARIFDY